MDSIVAFWLMVFGVVAFGAFIISGSLITSAFSHYSPEYTDVLSFCENHGHERVGTIHRLYGFYDWKCCYDEVINNTLHTECRELTKYNNSWVFEGVDSNG